MKNYIKHFSILLCLCLCAATMHAQNFVYNISSGTANLLSKITTSLTTLPLGSTINPGDNIAMPWGTTSLSNTLYKFTAVSLPSGATNLQWSVRGDLRLVSASGPSAEIMNANAINRGTPTDLGQSKGRITLSYNITGSPCGTISMTFDVFKQFDGVNNNGTATSPEVPAIVGPGCILPNTQYTYSIDPIVSDNLNAQIGMDRYFWDISQVGAVTSYYSTDSSSITFTTGSTVPTSCTIRCGLGMCNYPPLQTNASLQAFAIKSILASAGVPTVNLSGAATGVISSGTPVCVNTNGSTVTPLTFTVSPVQPGATYTWTFGTTGANGTGSVNGWNNGSTGGAPYTSTGSSLSITDIFNQPGTVTLKVTDACGIATFYYYEIKRALRPADASLLTLSGTCLNAGATATVTLAASANLNTLTWALPSASWTATTNSITPGSSVAPGSYNNPPSASFTGCSASSAAYTINVKPAAVTVSPTCYPANSTGNTVTAVPTTLCTGCSYAWTTTAGSITTPTTVNTTTLTTPVSTSPFNLTATYIVAAGCSTASATTPAYLQPVTPAVTLPSCIGVGVPSATVTVTVTNYPGYGSYSLTFTSGTNIMSTTTITSPNGVFNVPLNGNAGSGTYTVSHISGGCPAATTSITLATSSAPFTITPTQPTGTYVVLGASVTSYTYTWFNCGTNGTLPPQSPNYIYTLGNPVAGTNSYGAQATVGGCTYRVCVPVNGWQPRLYGGNRHTPEMPAEVGSVYPNPNSGSFVVELKIPAENAAAVVYDMNGKVVYQSQLTQGINRINDMPAAAGQYIIAIAAGGKFYTQAITVSKQ